jgi:hypothetical protein
LWCRMASLAECLQSHSSTKIDGDHFLVVGLHEVNPNRKTNNDDYK